MFAEFQLAVFLTKWNITFVIFKNSPPPVWSSCLVMSLYLWFLNLVIDCTKMYHELLNRNHIFLLWNSPILRTRISWVIKTKGCSLRPCNHWVSRHDCASLTPRTCIRPLHFTCQSFPYSVCIFFVLVCLNHCIHRRAEGVCCILQFLLILWAKNTILNR